MAHLEIEIKVQIEDNAPLLKFLRQNGTWQSEKSQKDEYFTPAHKNYLEARPIKEWFRLREEDDGSSLNYKNWHYHEDGKAYHCDEYEIRVGDPKKAKQMVNALGMKSLVIVNKKRQTFLAGDYEIALDLVEGLGDFVEIEYKSLNEIDPKTAAKQMTEFIEQTGAKIIKQHFSGYPSQLLEQKYGTTS